MLKSAAWKLFVASILFGAIGTFSALLRNAGISALVQTSFRVYGTVITLFLYLSLSGKMLVLPRRHLLYFLAYGLFAFVGMFIAYTSAVAMGTPVAITALLASMQPVYVLIMAALLLKERIDILKVIPVILSLIGAVVLVGGWNMGGRVILGGAFFAIMNGVCYALYLFMTKKLRAESGMDSMQILFWGYAAAAVAMVFVIAIMPVVIKDPVLTSLSFKFTWTSAIYLVGLSLGCTLTPYLLITQSLGKVELSKASISLLLEPVSGIVISALVLGEPVYIFHVIGGSLILLAVMLANLPQNTIARLLGRNIA
jgi:drug/metabolite transporter (DMT)-like permease